MSTFPPGKGSTRKPPKEPKAGRYHHGDLRRALLDAALEMVQSEGAATLSLREVARRAGVTHAAPYRHFESKEALLAAVAEEGFRGLEQAMVDAAATSADPVEQLGAEGVAYVRFAVEHPAHFRVMFGPASGQPVHHPEKMAASEGAFAVLVRTIEACVAAGKAAKRPPLELALVAWSLVHGLASLIVDGQLVGVGGHVDLAKMATQRLFLGLGSAT